jgi:cbb3-type cytochrome oxidase subunit 1
MQRIEVQAPDLPLGPADHVKTDEQSSVATPTKAEVYARAEQQMRRGKQLVISGFIVAVVGIVAYCVAVFSAGVSQELGSALLANPGWLVGPTLGVIGLGTLLWLVGSFIYLSGGMDSDPNGPDLYF